MNVLITRAQNSAVLSARAVRQAGHHPVVLPIFELRPVAITLPGGAFDATIFTSAAAPAMLRQSQALTALDHLVDLPAYCVGHRTAEAAGDAGFSIRRIGDGNAAELAQQILTDQSAGALPARARLLYPCAVDKAFDFRSKLGESQIVEMPIYEARAIDPGPDRLKSTLIAVVNGAVLVYSARSARHFFSLIDQHGLRQQISGLTLVGISEMVAANAPDWVRSQFIVAKSPNEAAMIAVLGE